MPSWLSTEMLRSITPDSFEIIDVMLATMPMSSLPIMRSDAVILDTEYLDTPGGLSGNDDAGQMSAWFVFSAMGFYPVCPATDRYYLGAPLFDRVTITPEGGKPFTITAPGASEGKKVFKRILLNGEPLEDFSITHSDLNSAGTLKFN